MLFPVVLFTPKAMREFLIAAPSVPKLLLFVKHFLYSNKHFAGGNKLNLFVCLIDLVVCFIFFFRVI